MTKIFSLLKIIIVTLTLYSSMVFSLTSLSSIDINTLLGEQSDYIRQKLFYDNKLFIVTGFYNHSDTVENLYLFDPKTKSSKLIDINSSGNGASPAWLTIYDNKLYFSANAGGSNSLGQELYEYDIKNNSTRIVADLAPGINSSYPSHLTVYDNKLYFSAYNNSQYSLYEFDIVTDKTRIVADNLQSVSFNQPSRLFIYNNKLYFRAQMPDHGYELFEYDSISNITRLVSDINPGNENSDPANFIIYNNKLLFTATNAKTGEELYEFDSVTDLTRLVSDINIGENSSYIRDYEIYNNKLFFNALNDTVGRELYEYNGLTDKVRLVEDINPSTTDTYPSNLAVYKNKLYFSVNDGINGSELYEYDGVTDKSTIVSDIRKGNSGSFPKNLIVFNNKLYFSAFNDDTGNELYQYDTNEVSLVSDMVPGQNSVGPTDSLIGASTLFFEIDGELYNIDKDSNVISRQCVICIPTGSSPTNITEYNQKLYFSADNGTYGKELYAYNNDSHTTELVADINKGEGSSEPQNLIVYNQKLYFTADNGENGRELYSYDSNDNSFSMIADIFIGIESSISSYRFSIAEYQDKLFFYANNGETGIELFEFDSNTNKVRLTADINPGVSSGLDSYQSSLFVFNNKLYFTADNGTSGEELFVYNGTKNIVKLAADINSGSKSSTPRGLTQYRGLMYFSANNGTNGNELYVFEDVTNRASLVIDNYTGFYNSTVAGPSELTVYNSKLYFRGYAQYGGFELYEYDGLLNTTRLVSDIYPGSWTGPDGSGYNSGYPTNFKVYKNKLYFSASNGINGTELFQYDSSLDAVSLVSDLNTSKGYYYGEIYPGSSEPKNMFIHNDKLFFSATSHLIGRELFTLYDDWQPDPNLDTDGDGIPDISDLDDDNDGIPDIWEITFGLNPLDDSDKHMDDDNDGISNFKEYQLGSNPQNGNEDADGDGYSNFEEHLVGSDPLNKNDIPANINSWIGILLNSQKPSQLNKH